jgi:ATP-dependent helicase HrpB
LSQLLLPIDEHLTEILAKVKDHPCLVIEAPPGTGKTTRVPPALMAFGNVVVLEPRRIAARMAARRVAYELGEQVGETVGFQVRFEDASGPRTRLRFVTEGVLTRKLLSDPELKSTNVVVLDEFHERHLDGDLALALLRRLQKTRRDLRIVVMSATLDGAAISRQLGGCPIVRSDGRLHPLSVSYTPHSAAPLEEQVRSAIERLLSTGLDGDVLAFLPGASEIRKSMKACEALAARSGIELTPLHSDLSPEEQDYAVTTGKKRKVIFSTNVAESSLTIEGVTAVIDSGVARVAKDSPWSGLPSLEIARISKASAEQRAGRAGRVRPGRVIRLYPQEDLQRRVDRDSPEIARRELSGVCLDLHAAGTRNAMELDWIDTPPQEALEAAEQLLRKLGALAGDGTITRAGTAMSKLPLQPRLSALVVHADRLGAGTQGCAVAAALSAGDRLEEGVDLLALSDGRRSPQSKRLEEQLRRLAKPTSSSKSDEPLLKAILLAFPDRVAKRRGNEFLLAGGGSAVVANPGAVTKLNFVVAVDVEQRKEKGLPLIRLLSGVEPEWLLDLFPDRVKDRSGVEWNREAERVETVSALLFENLVIEESRGGKVDQEAAAELLYSKAIEAGVARFGDPEEIAALLARLEFASQHGMQLEVSETTALKSLCYGLKSFAELKNAGLEKALLAGLSTDQRGKLDELAPERIKLQRGRSAPVNYVKGQSPWIASRLQDFFGMRDTPRVARGKVPVVVHLLAPNQRPVQTTSDLAGFWQRLYPTVRKELSRRYPKHAWPENPLS